MHDNSSIFKWENSNVKFLVIDEAGMISLELFYNLCLFISKKAPLLKKILIIGDPNQLQPIGYGNPLKSITKIDKIKKTYLTQIVRQKESTIPNLCEVINNGDFVKTIKYFKENKRYFKDKLVFTNTIPLELVDKYKNLISLFYLIVIGVVNL